jgi:glyoxylase-like metal-dependent hydrolase (beta-lactamase superfamily II)
MREVAPGVWHWTGPHPKLNFEVSSHFVAESGTLLDPIVPPGEGLEWFTGAREPQTIVLTNRHHDRDSGRFAEAFSLPAVLVPDTGLHEFEDKPLDVQGYGVGEEVVPGIVVHEVDAICPDDMALEIRSVGALALADSLLHHGDELRFVPDHYMDDPERTKQGLVQSLARLVDVNFDTLLFAHGEPLVGGAKKALRSFVEAHS